MNISTSNKSKNELWKWEDPDLYTEWTDGFVDNEFQASCTIGLLEWLLQRCPDQDLHQPQHISDYYNHYLATSISEENGAPVKIAQSTASDVKTLLIPFHEKRGNYRVNIIIEKRKRSKFNKASIGSRAQRAPSKRRASSSASLLQGEQFLQGEQVIQSTEASEGKGEANVKQEYPSWTESCYNPAEPPITLDLTRANEQDEQAQGRLAEQHQQLPPQHKRLRREITPSDRVMRPKEAREK